MLPLDLHVLGLPLAFILSQDQTLRCIKRWIIIVELKLLFYSYAVSLFLNLSKNFLDLITESLQLLTDHN